MIDGFIDEETPNEVLLVSGRLIMKNVRLYHLIEFYKYVIQNPKDIIPAEVALLVEH